MRLPVSLLAVLMIGHASPLLAEPAESAFKLSGYAKLMFVADDKKGGRLDQSTPGFGGRLGIETGELHGFSLKAAGYTTSDLGLRHDDPRKTDAYLFDIDKTPYSILGEAQLIYRHGNTTLTAGRQEFVSPIINSYEYRIIPNLFEAVTLKHRLGSHTATLAYVGKMSGLDGLVSFSKFRSMSQQAYVSMEVDGNLQLDAAGGDTLDLSKVVGQRGVWVAGIADEAQRFRLWNFQGVDMLNTLYLDGRWQQALGATLNASIEGQAYQVNEIGRFKDYLAQQGLNARYALVGLKATLAHPASGISVALAFNRFTGNRHTVTSFGNWGGYPEFVPMPYLYAESAASAIAQSRLARLTVLFDLTRFGLPGHSLLAGHAAIDLDENILANSDIKVTTLLYRAKLSPQLSARASLDVRQSNNARYDNHFATLALRYDF
ncbi:hypothetical protein MASR1M60_10010 [Rhodocyclaceae bacterium]